MKIIKNFAFRLENSLTFFAALLMLGMTILIFSDVFARYLFNTAIYGRSEIVELMMALLAFLSLPLITRKRKNIDLPFLGDSLKGRARTIHRWIIDMISVCILAGTGFVTWKQAETLRLFESRTQILAWPEYPAPLAIALICAIGALILLASVTGGSASSEETR